MNSKYKNLAKDTFVFAIGKFGSRIVLFFLVPLYTNYMTTSEYGVADLIFTISSLIVPILSFVIHDSIIRFGLASGVKKQDVLLNSFIVLLFSGIAAVICTPIIDVYKNVSEWKWYLCVYIIMTIADNIELNYLKVKGYNVGYSIISIIQTVILASLNIVLLICFQMGVKGYLLSTIISCTITAFLAFVYGRMYSDLRESKFHAALFSQMLKYSTPLILNNISWWVIHSSDKIMVGIMLGTSALGIYTVAAKIPSLINVIVSIFQQAWGISAIKEIETTTDTSFFSNIFKMFSMGVFFLCISVNSIIKPFMNLYVGQDFREAWQFVPLLLVSAAFSAVSAYFGSIYGALKKSVNNMLTTVTAAVVNIAINLALIPIIGIWGAIIGTVISYVVVSLARMFDIVKLTKVDINYGVFTLNTIIATVHAIIVSINFHPYVFSPILIVSFFILNKKSVVYITRKILRTLKL